MADRITQDERWDVLDEQEQREAAGIAPTLRMRTTHPTVTAPTRSYLVTRWALVNRALELTDRITHGRAGVLQRLVSYLFIGGTAALVNLGSFAILLPNPSKSALWYVVLANIIAYEVSIMANFVPNDYFTFRHLPGHQRSWLARCVRFHITSLSGILVTVLVSNGIFHLTGWRFLICQAIALIIATAYNFTLHHLFTYSHKKA